MRSAGNVLNMVVKNCGNYTYDVKHIAVNGLVTA